MYKNKLILLNQEIKNLNIKNLYFFSGNEFYLLNLYLKKIINALLIDKNNQFSYLVIKENEIDLDIIIDYINTLPIFSKNKILLIYNNFNLNKNFFKHLLNVYKDVYIIFITKDKHDFDIFIKNKIIVSENIYEFNTLNDSDLLIWIKKKFIYNNIFIDKDICSYLIFCCKRSMYNLKNEIDKITIYIIYNNLPKIVTLDLIDNLCYKISDAKIFEIINPIINKNYISVFSIINEFKYLNYDWINVFNFILGYFKKIYLVQLNINNNNESLMKLINTKSWYYLNIIKQHAAQIKNDNIKKILITLFQKEFLLKKINNKIIFIENMLINIMDILKI